MFEEYLQDSYEFFSIAQEAVNKPDERKAKRYYRASVFYASGAIEAFVNYVVDSFDKAGNLSPVEIAFLKDKKLTFRKGTLVEVTEFHRLDEKLRLLIAIFMPHFDFDKNRSWSKLQEFTGFRNSLIHPHQSEDETEIADYQIKVQSGLSGVIELMDCICNGIFKRPLRKQLLDLIPE